MTLQAVMPQSAIGAAVHKMQPWSLQRQTSLDAALDQALAVNYPPATDTPINQLKSLYITSPNIPTQADVLLRSIDNSGLGNFLLGTGIYNTIVTKLTSWVVGAADSVLAALSVKVHRQLVVDASWTP